MNNLTEKCYDNPFRSPFKSKFVCFVIIDPPEGSAQIHFRFSEEFCIVSMFMFASRMS